MKELNKIILVILIIIIVIGFGFIIWKNIDNDKKNIVNIEAIDNKWVLKIPRG